MGIRVFIVVCMKNAKSQFQPNRAFWRLELATRTSCVFESRANYLARLEVLSCSATVGVTLQLPCMLHICATFGDSLVARSNHEALLECTLLELSSRTLTQVEFIQSFCWLYSVPNLLVIQHLETLYLGRNHVRVVCERV